MLFSTGFFIWNKTCYQKQSEGFINEIIIIGNSQRKRVETSYFCPQEIKKITVIKFVALFAKSHETRQKSTQ